MNITDIKELASMINLGAPIIVAMVVVIFCISNIDKLLIFVSAIQKAFSSFSHRAKKGAISNNIRGHILKSAKAFRSLNQNIMISDLKIEWIKEETQEAFIKNNQVIVRMSQDKNPSKNFSTAVNAYVGEALLPKSRRYIDETIMNMTKLSVSRLIILNGNSSALEYFDTNILEPIFNEDSNSREIFEKLKTIDKNGMFVNILINEYAKATLKIYPDLPDPLLVEESKALLNYLHNIATGNVPCLNDFQFNREYFKIHIFLTANSETFKHAGIAPYLKHMKNSLAQGTETLYIFGLGRKIDIAAKITNTLQETDFRVSQIIPHFYRHRSIQDGHSVNGVCYEVCGYIKELEEE